MTGRRFQFHSWDELRDVKRIHEKGSKKCRKEAERLYGLGALDEWRSEIEHAELIEGTLMEVLAEYTARREEKAAREYSSRSGSGSQHMKARRSEQDVSGTPAAPNLSIWFDKMQMDDRPVPHLIWEVDRRIYLGQSVGGHLKVYVESPVPTQGGIVIVGRYWLPANGPSELGRSINVINAARRRR
ncbi:hypothetical protein [Amycolatopsis sp. RTGN1]|uniref:hypothetical protein n=1 Tax=Amycolatopsis ponsaeliensis TaxID=2992142 RepID=UPI00255155D4|nr:hypothetical protein [Amycolatopsis sp. RTGN1]